MLCRHTTSGRRRNGPSLGGPLPCLSALGNEARGNSRRHGEAQALATRRGACPAPDRRTGCVYELTKGFRGPSEPAQQVASSELRPEADDGVRSEVGAKGRSASRRTRSASSPALLPRRRSGRRRAPSDERPGPPPLRTRRQPTARAALDRPRQRRGGSQERDRRDQANPSAATISTVALTLRSQYKALVDSAKSAVERGHRRQRRHQRRIASRSRMISHVHSTGLWCRRRRERRRSRRCSGSCLFAEQATNVASDLHVLARFDDERPNASIGVSDFCIRLRVCV